LNSYTLQSDIVKIEVDGSHGGRLIHLGLLNGPNLLYEAPAQSRSDEWVNYGGDFLWVAPQELWGWPPIPAFDSSSWHIIADSNRIIQKSPFWDSIQLSREYSLVNATLTVKNRILNEGPPVTRGLWNISQFPRETVSVVFDASSEIKVFDFPQHVSLSKIIDRKELISLSGQKKLVPKVGYDYKIGCVSSDCLLLCKCEETIVEKRMILPNNSYPVTYPHGCNLELYKCDDYVEAEFVWPMTLLETGVTYDFEQTYTVKG
jgi:hypothetical protein